MKFKNPFSYIAPISQEFGKNPQIYNQFGMDGHNGLDFAIPEGTELFAVIDGEVTEIGYDATGYGNHIRTKNKDGIAIIYAHLSSISVSEGDAIQAGDLIAYTGNTGYSTGPHLHLGLRFYTEAGVKDYNNGYYGYFDPLPYFEDYNDSSETTDELDEVLADPDPVEDSEPLSPEDLPASQTPSEWAQEAYEFMILNKLSNGERPRANISREEFWLSLKRFSDFIGREEVENLEEVDFASLPLDQKPSEWAEEGYLWVRAMDISNGARPKEYISREEVWTMLQRFFKDDESSQENETSVHIENEASAWAKESQTWAMTYAISNGERPQDYISREEVWVMFERMYAIWG